MREILEELNIEHNEEGGEMHQQGRKSVRM
jgi:hypothetical protein